MLSIVLFVIAIKCIQSEDICDIIQTNDTFVGIRVYHKYDSNGLNEYIMYTKGKQWKFTIIDINGKPEVELIDGSVEDMPDINNLEILNRYGFDGKECFILLKNKNNDTYVYCQPVTAPTVRAETFFGLSDAAIFNPINDPKNQFVLALVKSLKKIWFVQDNFMSVIDENQCPNNTGCVVPDFVRQLLSTNLWNLIDGVADYDLNGSKGHVLFFNVDAKPKYCNTIAGQSLSTDCDLEKLQIYGKKCFSDLTTDTTINPNIVSTISSTIGPNTDTTIDTTIGTTIGPNIPSKKESPSYLWIVIPLVIIIIIAIIIAIIVIFVVFKTSSKSKSSSKSLRKVPKAIEAVESSLELSVQRSSDDEPTKPIKSSVDLSVQRSEAN